MRAMVWTVVLCAFAPVAWADDRVLVDEEYRFRLEAPSPAWRVLGESDMRKVSPDAIAGMVSANGVWAAVIAESSTPVGLEAFTRWIVDNMPLENKDVSNLEETQIQGRPAYRVLVGGSFNDLPLRYAATVFRNGDFTFQFICWTAAGVGPKDFDKAPLAAFTILPGPVVGRRGSLGTSDTEGVGWHVRDGRFASAALRIGVDPPEGWRLAIGTELAGMNADAEVGLVHSLPDVYMVLIAEPAAGVDRAAFAKQLMESWGDDPPIRAGKDLRVTLGERPVTLEIFHYPEQPFEFAKGVIFHGDVAMQILFWYSAEARDAALPRMQEAVRAVRLLTQEEAARVAEDLRAGPDPENRVGSGYALRRGVYRDFELGFTITKPVNEYWRMKVGSEAREESEEARVVLEHPARGLTGLLIVESGDGVDPTWLHETVVASTFEDSAPKARKTQLGGQPAFTTEADSEMEGLLFRFRVVTQVRGGFAYTLLFYGLKGNMQSGGAALDQLIHGIRFDSTLQAEIERDGGVEDHRLGYAFNPGPGWRSTVAALPQIAAIGSFRAWKGKSDSAVMTMALCAMEPGQDDAWFRDIVTRLITAQFGRVFGGEPATSEIQLPGGARGERKTWEHRDKVIEFTVLSRDRTFHALLIMGPRADLPEAERERLRSGFRLLD